MDQAVSTPLLLVLGDQLSHDLAILRDGEAEGFLAGLEAAPPYGQGAHREGYRQEME